MTKLPTLTLITLGMVGFCTLSDANPRAKFNKHARRGGLALSGDAKEFGAKADKFRAHQKLTAGGAGYYDKNEAALRAMHAGLYLSIQRAVNEDRISEEQARIGISNLFAIGESHKAAGANANAASTKAQLEKLHKTVREQWSKDAPADILSPRLNHMQFFLEEVIRYGVDSGELSKGELNSLRRKLDSLEKKEDKDKASGTLSDSDREKLLEEAREIWGDAIKDFK